MSSKRLVLLMVALGLVACQGADTDSLLNANIAGVDRSPPTPLYPVKSEVTVGLAVPFSWSARGGFLKYKLEISLTSDFVSQISGSPFTVSGTSTTVTLPDATTYWWRVSTALMQGAPQPATFEALNDAVLVYCRESTTCDDAGRSGNLSNPYQTIRAGIAAAKALGLPVRVASRGTSAQAYNESVSIADGVGVYGGYTSTFTESGRNISANVTAIASTAAPVIASYITKATVIEGLRIQGQLGLALYIDNATVNLVVRNNIITTGNPTTGNAQAVTMLASSAVLSGNTITSGDTVGSGTTFGIYSENSTASIIGNTIQSGNASGSGITAGILNRSSSNTISNNVVVGNNQTGTSQSYGINILGASTAKLTNNTITSGTAAAAGANSIGVRVEGLSGGTASPQLVNNIITTNTATNRQCIAEVAVTISAVTVLQNNLLFNCVAGANGALFYDIATGTAITAIGMVNSTTSVGAGNTASGNVTIAGAQNPFVNLGTKNFHLQNNGAPMTAQEWLDIAYGGLNTSGASFGSIGTDRDGITRTATLAGAVNAGAAGYSIGAYEF